MPSRIQRSRAKGWRMPEGAIYVGRPSKWGNPFRIVDYGGGQIVLAPDGTGHQLVDDKRRESARALAVILYTKWLDSRPEWVAQWIHDLRGKDLVCWCKQGTPCHADVLLELANRDA